MRTALLLLLTTAAWPLGARAQNQAAPLPAPMPVPVPYVVPPPPPPPAPYVPPAFAAARQGALDASFMAIRLVGRGRLDEAVAAFRRVDSGRYRADPSIYRFNALHLSIVARGLIRAGHLDRADELLARFLSRASVRLVRGTSYFTEDLFDLRLYIRAGRGDVRAVLRLLDARPVSRYCGARVRNMFPQVVAPLHHNPRVAARLRALGCSDDLLARLDDLASRPMGDQSPYSGLPPRPSPR